MKLILVGLGAYLGLADATGFGLTSQGCQCKSACELSFDLNHLTKSYCIIDVTYCPNPTWAAKSKDECASIFSDAWDWLAGSAGDVYTKMEGWTTDSIQNIDLDEISSWTSEQLDKIPMDKIKDMTSEQFKKLNIDALIQAGTAKVAQLAGEWDQLSDEQWVKLDALSAIKWANIMEEIPLDEMAKMAEATLAKIDSSHQEAIQAKLKSINLTTVAGWAQQQWEKVPVDNLAQFSWSALQEVPVEQLGVWTQENWKKIPVDKLVKFTGAQIAKIDAASMASLGDEYWDTVPVYQVVSFGVELLQSAELLEHLNATHVAAVTAEQWNKVPVEGVTKFTVDKLQAINYTALGGWSKSMWDQMPIETIANFAGKQIESIPSETVGNWTQKQWLKFDASQAVMFSGEQLAAGATELKGLTDEQLAKFDWKSVSASIMEQFPEDFQDKAKALAAGTSTIKTAYKELVDRKTVAKGKMDAYLKAWQDTAADSSASQADIDKALTEYEGSTASYAALESEESASSATINEVASTDQSAAFRAMPVVGAAMLVIALSI